MGQQLLIRACYNVILVLLLIIIQAEDGDGVTLVQNKYDKKEATTNDFFPSDGNNVIESDNSNDDTIKYVTVGSFRIGYTAPGASEPTTDDYDAVISATLSYLWEIQGYFADEIVSMGLSYSFDSFTYDSDPSADPNIRMQWNSVGVTFDTENIPPSGADIFDAIEAVIVGNSTYIKNITVVMVDTPFEKLSDTSIDNYITETLYPTWGPFPTPVPYPTATPEPVPTVTVPTGDMILEYTAPGASEFSSDDQRSLYFTTYGYLLNILDTTYYEFYSTIGYGVTYDYIGPDAVPNIFMKLTNFSVQFYTILKDIPTTNELQQVLTDSINASYLELIQQTSGEVFSLITDATMTFEEGNTPTVTPILTDAPVPKSRRGKTWTIE